MKAYSKDLRDKVVAAYNSGEHNKLELSKLFSISYATIKRWFQRLEATGSYEELKPTEPKRKILFDDKEAILLYLKEHPKVSHINGIESFWSYAKIRLVKFRGISKQNFYLHLKECEFRFNCRSENMYATILPLLRNNPL